MAKTFSGCICQRPRTKLKQGIYTILVRNDRDHEFEVFGALGVVKEGNHIPNEEYRVKDEHRYGQVVSALCK